MTPAATDHESPEGDAVLLVEDSATQAEQLRQTLDARGFDVRVATCGEEALGMLAAWLPRLIISDILMPGIDGYELCRRVKTSPRTQQVPVMLLTTLSSPEDVIRGLECGADNFLTKPWEAEHLLSHVRYILANQRLQPPDTVGMGLEVFFEGRTFHVTSTRLQILNLLLSTYQEAVKKERALERAQEALRELNEVLEDKVRERTSALAQEVVDRRRAEEALGVAHQQLRNLFDSIDDVVFSLDLVANRVLLVSPACRTLFGFGPEEFRGDASLWLARMHPDDRVVFEHARTLQALPLLASDSEFRIVRPDGSIRWVHARVKRTMDRAGRPLRLDGVLHDVTESHDAAAQLASSLREKEALLKEVHHRVKNNMQVISSFLNLERHKLHDAGDAAMFENCQNRVHSMALVHELLYATGKLARVEIGEYTRRLLDHLQQSLPLDPDRLRMALDVEGIQCDSDTAVPCGLILNELVSNAIKHAFPDGREGTVHVRLSRTDAGAIELCVDDDGVGLPPELDVERASTMGFQIVRTLTQQLNGHMVVHRNGGTRIAITFPL